MQIKDNGNNGLTITGNIKTVEDSLEIQKAITTHLNKGIKNVLLKMHDSFSMTSTVIGHLMKLVNVDKISVSLIVADDRLYELLEELCLVQLFNVRLVAN